MDERELKEKGWYADRWGVEYVHNCLLTNASFQCKYAFSPHLARGGLPVLSC